MMHPGIKRSMDLTRGDDVEDKEDKLFAAEGSVGSSTIKTYTIMTTFWKGHSIAVFALLIFLVYF